MFKNVFTASEPVKPMINIGCLMDVPTGLWSKGKYGEYILNGGLGYLTGMVGIGNCFKSTIAHYMNLSAASKFDTSSLMLYDLELNTHRSRLNHLASFHPGFNGEALTDTGRWLITDKSVYYGGEWFSLLTDILHEKGEKKKEYVFESPFVGSDGKLLPMWVPSFIAMDTFTDFETKDVVKIQEENELGDSGGNTMHMRQGLAKLRLLSNLPVLSVKYGSYFMLVAQLGKDIQMPSGPGMNVPIKKLNSMKAGDKVKGVTDKFFFLMHNTWNASTATLFNNNNAIRSPEYPRDSEDNQTKNTDLFLVNLVLLRSKSGPTFTNLEILVSQKDGVLPTLTEFNYLKNSDRFGISGSLQTYHLDLLPEVNLSRTTVRRLIDTNPQLVRAMNITAELCQLHTYLSNPVQRTLLCTPKELREDLEKQGYDWNVLLATRGWYTINNDKHPIPYLSTMDLLQMRAGKGDYVPYWMNKDKQVKGK